MPEIEHDITQVGGTYGWAGHCHTHDCTAIDDYVTADAAREAFICDGGTGGRYVVQIAWPDLVPSLTIRDLTGLHAALTHHNDALRDGYGAVDGLTVWQWAGDGTTQPVTIRRSADGTAWVAELDGVELVRA